MGKKLDDVFADKGADPKSAVSAKTAKKPRNADRSTAAAQAEGDDKPGVATFRIRPSVIARLREWCQGGKKSGSPFGQRKVQEFVETSFRTQIAAEEAMRDSGFEPDLPGETPEAIAELVKEGVAARAAKG